MTLALLIAGRRYEGWTEVAVTRGMDRAAGDFSLRLSPHWSGQTVPSRLRPGDACRVDLDGEAVITGFIDDVTHEYDDQNHALQVRGRSRTGDLVDCSVVRNPPEWKGRRLEQIAADMCTPFAISVTAEADTGAVFPVFNVNQGESVFEAVEKLCRFRAVLATDDANGNLVITRAAIERLPGALTLGGNVTACRAGFTMSERYSEVIVKGQQPGSDFIDGKAAAAVKGRATDDGVGRYRPLVLVVNTPIDAAAGAARARHEAAVRFGRAATVIYTVAGWRDDAGALWRPNRRIAVVDDFVGLARDMLITSVFFRLSGGGTVTELELVRPEAYERLEGLGAAAKKDFWADVRKQVQDG